MVESRPLEKALFHVTLIVGIAISILSAYAIVYFRFPLRKFLFWIIFMILMLAVEVRILPSQFVKGLIETEK